MDLASRSTRGIAYIHNSHGWFHFASVLAAQGVDLVAQGWDPTNLAITAVRTVDGVDLVLGQGQRRTVGAGGYVNGVLEGFVAQLPAGVLAAFNPAPTPPTDRSIVGAWALGSNPATAASVVTYQADGTYVSITSAGFERGLYTWAGNAAGGAITFTTLYDANGSGGLSGINGYLGRTLIVTGDTHALVDTNCGTCAPGPATRIAGGAGEIIGGWVQGHPGQPDNAVAAVFSSGGKYFLASDNPTIGKGVDLGTYTWDSLTHVLTTTPTGGMPDSGSTATLTSDELGLAVVDPGLMLNLTRVVDPATVPPVITNRC